MGILWSGLLAVTLAAESGARGVAATAAGSMMEGKEVRFGIPGSALFAVATTGTSTGAVNSAHDSMSPPSAAARSCSTCCSAKLRQVESEPASTGFLCWL